MAALFGDRSSEDEGEGPLFGRSAYADNYTRLRRKEELLKLKNKYGESIENCSESSSSDDSGDDDISFTEEFEKNFFTTLSCLKRNDPKIYDREFKFFNEDDPETKTKPSKKKEKAITVRDYNRDLILNKAGIPDEDNETYERPQSPSYVEEQKQIKDMFKKVVDDNDDDKEENIGGLFSKKNKTKVEEEKEKTTYREWLSGQTDHLDNLHDETELKTLKDFWADPNLDKDEAFLRDYILNKRYKENVDKGIPTYDEIVNPFDDNISEDERQVAKEEEFEHKFNFRFEEPDQEFIKQYPRTFNHSIRRKDDKRSQKRLEIKERKTEEKMRKKEEINQLKAMKLKELQEKIVKLKQITGNDQLAFDTEDIEGEFDPDAHDQRMKELFDDNYYGDTVDTTKPEFPDLDDEMEIENWELWEAEKNNENEPHCEDDSFNMDCDFDPKAVSQDVIVDLKDTIDGTSKRKRKRRSKLAQALTQIKPAFDPNKVDKTLSQYLDEYYKLDCEDVIGDMPCRYKYREVPACNYGLTMEEILLADDKELNKWYPLKKTLQCRSAHLDLNDQKVYEKKAMNIKLKMQILPSLYNRSQEENDEMTEFDPDGNEVQADTTPKKKNKKKKKPVANNNFEDDAENNSNKRKRKLDSDNPEIVTNNDSKLEKPTKKNKSSKKRKLDSSETLTSKVEPILENKISEDVNTQMVLEKKSKKKKGKQINDFNVESIFDNKIDNQKESANVDIIVKAEKKKKRKTIVNDNVELVLEDEINSQTEIAHNDVIVKAVSKNKKKNKKENLVIENNVEFVSNNKKNSTKSVNDDTSEPLLEDHQKLASEKAIKEANALAIAERRRKRKRESKKHKSPVTPEVNKVLKPLKNGNIESAVLSRRRKKRNAAQIMKGISNTTNTDKTEKNATSDNTRKSEQRGVSKNNTGRIEKKHKLNNHQKINDKTSKLVNSLDNLTDERLQAYGMNPKKYRSFMKFKKY